MLLRLNDFLLRTLFLIKQFFYINSQLVKEPIFSISNMSWKKLKHYSNSLLVFLLFSMYSNCSMGQQLDTIFIDLKHLSKQDTILEIHYNIPKAKCKEERLAIYIQLENYDTSMIHFVHRFKGNGYVERVNSDPVIIDPKVGVFYETWVLQERLFSKNCTKNRQVQSISVQYHNAFYNIEKASRDYQKSIRIMYTYVD